MLDIVLVSGYCRAIRDRLRISKVPEFLLSTYFLFVGTMFNASPGGIVTGKNPLLHSSTIETCSEGCGLFSDRASRTPSRAPSRTASCSVLLPAALIFTVLPAPLATA